VGFDFFDRFCYKKTFVEAFIRSIWRGERGSLLLPFLHLLSLLYRAGLLFRDRVLPKKKVQDVGIPVISIGNLSVGGTGKTSLAERLSLYLKEKGYLPCIVTRGHKRKRGGTFFVDPSKDSPRDVGDEPLLLARKTGLPVVVSKDRAEAIRRALVRFNVNVAILDDGFQVRGLKKDLEILILHEKNGNSYDLLPKGPLREGIERLKDAHILLCKQKGVPEIVEPLVAGKPLFRLSYSPLYLFNLKTTSYLDWKALRGKRVLAFSGLGDNEGFFELLRSLGAKLVECLSFPDHHNYTKADMARLRTFPHAEMLLTTEKDAVRLQHVELPDNLFYLSVRLAIEREEEFFSLVEERLKEKRWQGRSTSSTQR